MSPTNLLLADKYYSSVISACKTVKFWTIKHVQVSNHETCQVSNHETCQVFDHKTCRQVSADKTPCFRQTMLWCGLPEMVTGWGGGRVVDGNLFHNSITSSLYSWIIFSPFYLCPPPCSNEPAFVFMHTLRPWAMSSAILFHVLPNVVSSWASHFFSFHALACFFSAVTSLSCFSYHLSFLKKVVIGSLFTSPQMPYLFSPSCIIYCYLNIYY